MNLGDSHHNYLNVSRALGNIGWSAFDLEDYYQAIDYFKRSLQYQQHLLGQETYSITLEMNIGQACIANKRPKEAEYYFNQAVARGKPKTENYGNLLNLPGSSRMPQQT